MNEGPRHNGFDGFVDDWYHSSVPLVLVPLLVLGFQAGLFVHLHLMEGGSGPSRQLWGAGLLMMVACLALVWRRRWPVPVLLVELLLPWFLMPLDVRAGFLAMPTLIILCTIVLHCGLLVQVVGTALALVSSLGADLASARHFGGSTSWMPIATQMLLVVGIASSLRLRREQLEKATVQGRVDRLGREQAESRRQGRIAAELHDGVGHNLTAMIALTEGLDGSKDPEQLSSAMAMVNELARTSLEDTRRTVRLLQPGPDLEPLPQLDAGWGQLESVLDTVRRAGLVVALTETGVRPDDQTIGLLTHTVVREALTNVMRHADGATRATVSLDHGNRATVITVTDDGTSPAGSGWTPGTGLDHLRQDVEGQGGSFLTGPTGHGWQLVATIPHRQEKP